MRNLSFRLALLIAGSAVSLAISSTATAQDAPAAGARTRSLDAYSNQFGVPLAEAQRRIGLQREIGKIGARLESEEATTFGGLYIEHKPAFRAVVKFTADGAATLARYTQDPIYTVETAAVPLKEMADAQRTVYDLLKKAGIESSSRVDVIKGALEFYVADPTAVQLLQSTGALQLPAFVTLHRALSMDTTMEATVEGGRPLSGGRCTSGYTVYGTAAPSTRYLSTAGHCATPLTYNGVTLPRVGVRYQAGTSYDYAWHSTPGFSTLTNVIYDGIDTSQRITYVWPYASMAVGDWVCKWGSATGYTCGQIASKTYNAYGHAGFVQVHNPDNLNLSDAGDSGAPWYYDVYEEAWGSHSDSADAVNANDAIYMPMSYISAWGHAVLTTP
jgi:hypothetical protein